MKTSLGIVLILILGLFVFGFLAALNKPAQIQQSFGLHYGANSTKEFFEDAYQNISTEKPNEKIFGITVNHHLLAPNLIAKEFSLVATDKPITVILISPNHFFRGSGGVISSKFDWQTPYGVLQVNQALVDKLQKTGLVNVDETPFEQEHGINNIVGFIKKSLPNATFVPLIIKENLSDEAVDKLAAALPKDVLVVGSLDFSHYLTSNAAEFHDEQTLAAMQGFDYSKIKKLDIDSHPGLRLLLKYFELQGAQKFIVTSHENSSTVTGNYTFLETTSYINGYFTAGPPQADNVRTVLYLQNLDPKIPWKPDAADRLYKYNDSVVFQEPADIDALNLGKAPMAVGLVYTPKLTDIYMIPLDTSNNQVKLLPKDKSDKILKQLGLSEHIIIK